MLAWLFYRQIMAGSLVVDGTRYFTLDDDMMVSMRYGRNLAEGHGLVWNPGQYVEGYTNFLWTLVMAGVHVLPFGDAHAALGVKLISWALLVASLWLSLRLLRVFVPRSRLAAVLVVVGIVTCVDVVQWSAWGFETTLLGFLQLVFLVCLLEGRRMPVGWIALALIPLVRSDALYLFAADASVALFLSRDRRRTAIRVAAALVPFVLHLVFRRLYYGDWLPNTYYLKLHLLDDRYGRGVLYVGLFVLQYGTLLILGGIGAVMMRRDRRALAVPVVIVASLAYVATAGGDMLYGFRFFAHLMPLVFVVAAIGVVKVGREQGAALAAAVAVFLFVCIAPWRPLSALTAPDNNGDPGDQLQTAMLIKKNARPDSRIAVIAAGIVPYFTRMEAVDMLGKSDRHIARLRPFPGAKIGHGKLDPAYSLSSKPDLVVSYRNIGFVRLQTAGSESSNPVNRFLASPPFQREYLQYPIEENFLLSRTAVFTRPDSAEYAGRRWRNVTVGR